MVFLNAPAFKKRVTSAKSDRTTTNVMSSFTDYSVRKRVTRSMAADCEPEWFWRDGALSCR